MHPSVCGHARVECLQLLTGCFSGLCVWAKSQVDAVSRGEKGMCGGLSLSLHGTNEWELR